LAASQKKGKTELCIKNEGALGDYLLDRVCRQTARGLRWDERAGRMERRESANQRGDCSVKR
jgi:hypothetical protein